MNPTFAVVFSFWKIEKVAHSCLFVQCRKHANEPIPDTFEKTEFHPSRFRTALIPTSHFSFGDVMSKEFEF